jgi:hypothetical protein
MNEDDRVLPEVLKDFVPRPAPPHLRTKVLIAAAAIPPAGRFLTAAQWGMAAACALLVIGALAGDAALSRAMAGRLDVLLNERPVASPVTDADRTGLEEILGADQVRLLGTKTTRLRRDSAIRIDGRMDGKGSSLEDKEDADVHSQNPR